MAITVIFSDMGDVDCASIPNLWKDIPDVNVLTLSRDGDVTKDDIREAIKGADDTLIMCGHGTPSGLLGFVCEEREDPLFRQRDERIYTMKEMYEKAKGDRNLAGALGREADKLSKPVRTRKFHRLDNAVDASMVDDIHAERVIAVWCHATRFAETHHLYGFWSSMFISNSGEAAMCGYPGIPNSVIDDETMKFWVDANRLLKENVPLDRWIPELMRMGHMDLPTTKFNYNGLRYYPK